MNQKPEWLKTVNNITSKNKTQSFIAKDKLNRQIVLEWIKTDLMSPENANAMKSAWPIAKPTYTKVEMDFLKSHPEVVGADTAFTQFEPLFKDGINNVNWNAVETQMQKHLKSIFIFDYSGCSKEMQQKLKAATQIFIAAKEEQSNEILGFIQFLILEDFAYGDIKCIAFAVNP